MKVPRYEVPGKREEGNAVPTGTIEMSLLFSLSSLIGSPKLFINLGPKSQGTAPSFLIPAGAFVRATVTSPLDGTDVSLCFIPSPERFRGCATFIVSLAGRRASC